MNNFFAVDLEIGNEGVAESESRILKLKKLMRWLRRLRNDQGIVIATATGTEETGTGREGEVTLGTKTGREIAETEREKKEKEILIMKKKFVSNKSQWMV